MMDVTKVEQNKQKTRGKVSSNSNQSFKFIEKESLSGCSLSFTNLPSSLCSFIPKEQESLSHEIDFEIAKHLKKLEKKDPVTKQKSLNHLLEIFKTKDEASVISTLKFWPKLYNRLSLDEDKKVRELTQQLMGCYSSVCGKEISSIIKNLLPTWIISQSDLHIAAANIAKQSFIDTFPTKIKQEKAYLLCWRSIYSIISVNLSKTPVKVNDDISYTPKEEAYIQDIVVNVRTINTLIPYLKNNEEASNDLVTLLSSKNFWAHFKQNITLIQSVYIQLSAELLNNLFGFVQSSSFLSSNVCECFRMIDNYNSQLISRIWDTIVKCCKNFGEDVWKFVSFKTVFLPKLLKLLECGAEGNISQVYSCMLPFFTHLPITMTGADATGIYDKIIAAMTVGAECTRIIHNEFESTCAWKMIYECSVYTILVASNATTNNTLVVTAILNRVLGFTLRQFSEVRFKAVGQTMSDFVSVFIRPIITKTGVSRSQLIDTFLSWVEEQHTNVVFCDRLARWMLEFDRSVSGASESVHEFRLELLTQLELKLKEKVITGQYPQCVVPYFCILFSLSKSDSMENTQMVSETALTILHQCGHLMRSDTDPVLIDIIGHGIAFLVSVLDTGEGKDCTIFERFLETLEPDQLRVFFARFYQPSLGHLTHKSELRQCIIYSKVLLSSWETAITNSVRDYNEDQKPISETWPSILLELCDGRIQEHGNHLVTVIRFIDIAITSTLATADTDNHLSSNNIDWLLHLIGLCLTADCVDYKDGHSGSRDGVVPISLLRSMLQLALCRVSSDGSAPSLAILSKDIEPITEYLLRCPPERASFLVLELIGETVSSEQHHVTVVPEVVKALVQAVLGSARSQVISTLESGLVADLDSLETVLASQLGYRFPEQMLCVLPVGGQHHCLLVRAVRCVYAFSMLQLPSNEASVDCAVLVHAAIRRAFSSCHYSSQLLEECERLHKFLTTVLVERNSMIDRLVLSLTTSDQSDDSISTGQSAIFKRCPLLAMCALDQMLSTCLGNYSQWTGVVSSAIDWAIISCTDPDDSSLHGQKLSLVTRVLLPCAIRARYLVQEQMLAAVSAFLAVPDLGRVNRAISISTGLCAGDPSFFPLLMPLVLTVKPVFLAHLDTGLDLVALLQFLATGLDSSRNRSCELDQAQWEFVLCMIETLIRAPHLGEPMQWQRDEAEVDTDGNKTLYWLLRLIATTTLSMATLANRQSVIVDEWTDLFSGPIYTALLDRFSEAAALAGPPSHVGLALYLEALADAVSLCPGAALLQHGFTGASVGLQDPLDLPAEFLLAFNWLLESMSSEALPVQLASYHCLVELAGGRLVELLLTQMDAPRNADSADNAVSIQLPQRLVDLLETVSIDDTDPVRGLLAWNLVLHLVTGAPPKLRAEICSFLTGPERCFNRFLGSCFAFMPKNPLVSRRHLSFMESAAAAASSINLIVDEPDLFTRCHSNRSQFTVYHLAAHTFRRSLQVLPNLCRQWWRALDSPSQQLVDAFVRQFVTRELFRVEFEQLQRHVGREFDDDRITIKTLPVIGEVVVTYHVSSDQTVEQLIRMPGNYPIGSICTEYKKEMTTAKIRHWKHWMSQMSLTLENQNGSIFDGIRLWKRNLDNYFAGIEECMICYSIIHPSKFNLPSMPCYQCKKKFHKECMYKWFHSSANPTCPNCRNVFYDGSQKIGVR